MAARRRSEHKRDERQRRRAARKRRTKVAARQLVSKLEVVVVDLPEVRGRRGAVRRHSAHDAYARVSERTCVLHSAAQRSARVLADAAAAAPTEVARQQKIERERDTHKEKRRPRRAPQSAAADAGRERAFSVPGRVEALETLDVVWVLFQLGVGEHCVGVWRGSSSELSRLVVERQLTTRKL